MDTLFKLVGSVDIMISILLDTIEGTLECILKFHTYYDGDIFLYDLYAQQRACIAYMFTIFI